MITNSIYFVVALFGGLLAGWVWLLEVGLLGGLLAGWVWLLAIRRKRGPTSRPKELLAVGLLLCGTILHYSGLHKLGFVLAYTAGFLGLGGLDWLKTRFGNSGSDQSK